MFIVVLHQGSVNTHGPSWTPKWTLKLILQGNFGGPLPIKDPPRSLRGPNYLIFNF